MDRPNWHSWQRKRVNRGIEVETEGRVIELLVIPSAAAKGSLNVDETRKPGLCLSRGDAEGQAE